MSKRDGKVNIKAVIGVVVLLLVMVLVILGMDTIKTYLSGAAAGVEPTGVSVAASNGEATVTWTSEKPSMGVVEYGTSPASLLLRAPETESTTSHRVVLSPLRSGVSYYLRIRVGDEVFDNNGIPYSFKTKDGGEAVGETQVTGQPTMTPVAKQESTGEASCSSGVDYNGDGVVNSFDMVACKSKKTSQTGTTTVPVVSGSCKSGTDYDGNGVVNSFDMVKCLQTQGD